MNKRPTARRVLSRTLARKANQQQRRAMLFESLEGRALMATITGNTAIGGFEALNSASLLYQLSASNLVLANGAPVTAWNNSGTAANNFTQATVAKQPTFVATSTLGNNQPAVSFDGNTSGQTGNPIVAPNADELILGTSTSPATLFIVNSTATANGLDGIIGTENGDFGIRRLNNTAWQQPGNANDFANPGTLSVNGVAGTNPPAALNTPHILTAARPAGSAITTTSIGDYFQVGANAARSWGGQIGDVLAFSRALTTVEKLVIENSLAAKYGITLGAGDIYAGDNPALGDYDRGVIGVGGQAVANVALGKTATLSNQGHPQGDAPHGVDGNTNGNYGSNSVTHSDTNTNPFLNVNLGDSFSISSVDLWNRTDCCGDRMRDIRVQILDAAGAVIWQNPSLINPGNVLGSPTKITVDVVALSGGLVTGNQVRVVLEGTGEIINIAEVQVWATSQYTNVAVGKTAIQSSVASGGTPDRAVDGNTDGSFGNNSVTHTNTEANPFWRVDLGADTPINQIMLYNRTDCCGDRLSDITVEILNSSLTPVFTATGLNAGNSLDNPYMFGVDAKLLNGGVPVTGRYVRVTAVGASKILSLAELQVMTAPVATGAMVASAGSNGFGIEQTAGASMSNYLTAGYKQVANSLVNTDLPAGVDSRWDRAWYVDKTGTMNATLAFDFSDAGLSLPASTLGYQLLYSPNNNFEASNSSFTPLSIAPTVVGDTVTFSVPNASLNDGYYTLGLLDQAATLQAGSATAGDGTPDAWRIVRSGGGANLDFYQGASLVRSTPYASITSVTVTGSGDNDTFTVDQSGGVIAKPISYAGNGQTSVPGDSLVISGGAATTINHTFINNSDGNVNIDGSVISYTGLEPITDNMSAVNRIFTFTGAAETIVVSDSAGAGISRIDSTLGEFVDFSVPTTSLTITTNGGDTTNINSLDAAFNTPTISLTDASGTTSNFNLGASNIIPDATALSLTGNVSFNLNGFNETIGSLASTNATPNLNLSAGQTLTTGNAANTTYSGTIAGGGGLIKAGAGIFTIPGSGGTTNNTVTGLLRVDAGTIVLGGGFTGDGAWKGDVTVNNTGTLQFAQNNIVANGSDFTINAGGVLNLAGFSDAIGNLQGAGSITNNGGITLDDLSGTRTFSGTIAGGGALTLRGNLVATGTQVLDGTSYNFGGLVVGQGTLTFNNTPTVVVTGTFAIGDTNGAGVAAGAITAVANINGGTLTIGHIEVGNRQSGAATVTATVNQTAGTMTVSGGQVDGVNVRIGHWPSTNAFYNLSGAGVLTATTGVGTAVDGNGTFTQTGGTLNAPTAIVNLRSANGTGTFTLNGGTANIGTGGITTTGTPGVNSFLNLGGATVRATGTFSSSHDAVLTNAVGPAIFDTNGFNITMSGVLSGAGALTKNGNGTLFLSGANSFGGAVTINAGTLSVGDIADSGSNSHLGAGTGITLNGGILQFTAATTDSSNRPITLGAGNGGIDVSNAAGNITYSGGVTGGTSFTKIGAGQLTFSPANVAVSNLFIVGGQLTLAGSGTTTVTGTILPGAAVADGALATGNGTLNISGSVVVNAANISINNQSSTIGTINQSGTSAVTVPGGVRIGHWSGGTGTYNISGGTLAATGAPAGVVNIAGVGEQVGAIYLGVDGTGVLNISGTGAVSATAVVLDGRGDTAGTDTLSINGGSLTLGNNTNATTIAGSGLFVGSLNANTTYQINLGGGGTLRSITPFTTPLKMNLTGTGANAINVDTNGVNLSFTGVLSGVGGLAKVGAGTLLLSNTNTYADVTNVNGGTLQLQNGAAILDTAGAVSVALGATLQLLNNETVSSYNGAGDLVGTNDSLLALGANTLTTTGNAAIANVTTAAGAGIVAGGNITDTDDDNNITGPEVYLQASTGIGTALDPIETAVTSIQLNNTTSGVVNVSNSNAGALLTLNNIRPLGFAVRNLGGAATVVTAGPLTVANNVTASGAVSLSTTDTGASENIVVNNTSVTIQSTGSTLTLNSGDNVTIPATARLAASGSVAVNVDVGNADAGTGGVVNFAGDVDATLAIFNGVTDTVGDAFNIRPDQDTGDVLTPIQVFGFGPAVGVFPAGDGLTLDITGLGIPTLTLGPGARNGSFSFGALAASLTYNNIETVATSPPGSTYHVVLDMKYAGFQDGAADSILMQVDPSGTNLLLDVNGGSVLNGPKSNIESLTIIGSSDNDALTIQETAGGLPRFNSGAPAVNNTGIGGGVSAGAHLNTSADLVLETLRPVQTPWDANDVSIQFDGGLGTDSLNVNYTTLNNTGYFSDTNDGGNSGNVMAAPGAFPALGAPTLLLSVANIEPINLTGAGGTLLVDATGTAATANITFTDIGTTTQLVADGGVATTTFSGYASAVVVGGTGAELIDVVSIDNATLTSLQVVGGSTNDLLTLPGGESSADTIRLRSLPSTASALLQGNAGSDSFQLFDGTNTVDNIQGPVVVDGNDGSIGGNIDTLTIIDSGDVSGADTVIIGAVNAAASQDYFIDGITSTISSDVVFRNIDVLDYTATTFNDSIDGRFVNTTPAHDLSTVNLSGWTGSDQFLLFTSDQFGGTGPFTPTATTSGVANINLYGDAPGNPHAGDLADIFGALPPGIVGTGTTNVGMAVASTVRMIRPSASTAIAIDGGQPTGLAAPLGDASGDVNNIDISALPNTNSVIVSTFAPGTVVATGIQPLTWSQIEDINLVDQGKLTNVQMGDLFARTTPSADFIQMTRSDTLANPNRVRLRITAFSGDFSASNKTIIYGGGQNDNITQANLTIPAEIYGEGGDDIISGATNNDWLVGGDGNDRINGGLGDNVIWGDNSPSTLDPTPQNALTGGDDILSGLTGNDVFYGSGGNDQVSAGGGSDYANGGAGNDTLDGNDGDDRLYGGAGEDILSGSRGNDLLSGGGQNDKLYGDEGNDVIFGGTGADLIDGGGGNDLLISGAVANEASTWTSVANTTTFSPATYTNGADNDNALLTLIALWGSTGSNSTGLGAITHDGANDHLFGGLGDDDFCWEAADVSDLFPRTTPSDFLEPGMGADQRIPPNS